MERTTQRTQHSKIQTNLSYPQSLRRFFRGSHINTPHRLRVINSSTQTANRRSYGLEDIKQTETTFERGDTIDRTNRSSSNNRIRYHSMGSTTLTIHRVEYEQ